MRDEPASEELGNSGVGNRTKDLQRIHGSQNNYGLRHVSSGHYAP